MVDIARRVQAPITDAMVRRVIAATLRAVRCNGDLSVAFVGPVQMRTMNRTYHGSDDATDVLAFAEGEGTEYRNSKHEIRNNQSKARSTKRMHDFGFRISDLFRVSKFGFRASGHPFLGEILICPLVAKRNAARAGEPLRRELIRLLIHGTLHCCGYDHAKPTEAEEMFRMQEGLVNSKYPISNSQ